MQTLWRKGSGRRFASGALGQLRVQVENYPTESKSEFPCFAGRTYINRK